MTGQVVKALVSFAALALLLASCGGDSSGDDNAGSDGPPLTKAQFIEQGDAICKKAMSELFANSQAFVKKNEINRPEPSEAENLELLVEIYLPHIESRLTKLQELSPPAADEQQIEEIFAATEDALATARKSPKKVLGENLFEEPKSLFADYGFKACGKA